jgi:hypothetical protein
VPFSLEFSSAIRPWSIRPRADEDQMDTKPIILPLDIKGTIYALQDEKGNTIGTGTREVCEVLLHMITKALSPVSVRSGMPVAQRTNVRAAIAI